MTLGIVGLGLIGGSMAKAYAENGQRVYAANRNKMILDFAILSGDCHGVLDETTIPECDLLMVGLPPVATVQWIQENAHLIAPHTMVMDLCGTKKVVCEACFPLAAQHGFTFVGGHPMAGTQFSGFKYAKVDMFKGQPMVLVPPAGHSMELLDRCKELLKPAGFGKLSVTTAEAHDQMIAYTSQMCHVVSSAFIKSPTAMAHEGFSAGSYRDLTRVARLNPDMWAELMLENRENMVREMDILLHNLQAYRDALYDDDYNGLRQLLDEGRRCKEEVDGR